MKHLIISLIGLAVAVSPAADGGLVINEYHNGKGTVSTSSRMVSDEYIEFAITKNMTSDALSALTFGDSNSATSALQSVFKFDKVTLDSALEGAGRKDFLAGTLFVVKGTDLGSQNLSYNPQANNITNNDLWSIELVAGLGAVNAASKLISGSINIANKGDIIWVSSGNPPANNVDIAGVTDAIGHTTESGYIAKQVVAGMGSAHLLNAEVITGSSVINSGGQNVALTTTTVSTLAAPNGDTNTLWINGMRTANFDVAPEPSRLLLLIVGSLACLLRRTRSTSCIP